jgi:p-hydroxybenzoate 3-monooxygenase
VPQQALVRALIAAFTADGGDLRFEAAEVALHGLDTDRPSVTYTGSDGGQHEIECDFVAGCDGDHGSTHSAVPDGVLTEYATDFGITWLTVLADAPPPRHPCLATGERGYAAHFARGPAASRFYLAVPPGDTRADWPGGRIWEQLRFRFHQPGLPDGPITETEIFPLRALVREPMSYGRLYLLGDAAHIISPMGAKGMNLALRDAEVFATAVRDFVRDGDGTGLRAYSGTCLARVWKYQEWSEWMLEMMHGICPANSDPFRARLLRARLDRMTGTETGSRYWAEMMTGLG